MSLDDRLIDILQHTTQAESIPLQVAQIKQAFAEEGWGKLTNIDEVLRLLKEELMTGQEWYDRFEREAPGSAEPHVFEAARKAAGL